MFTMPEPATVQERIAMPRILGGYWHFIWAALVKQGQTGAIVPSQRFLIAKMIAPVPRTYRGQIIELGAANGAITLGLAARCPEARILACDINPILARENRNNLAKARINGRVEVIPCSAERLLSEVRQRGRKRPGYIISGIPLGNLSEEKGVALIDAIAGTLGRNGMYIQFQHSLLHRKTIRARFRSLRTVPVLLNLPPAVVYYAQT
jgi:phospholipid N-methyltransferase